MKIDVAAYYEKYGPMVFRRCKYLLRSEEEALDATQDVFLNLIRQVEKLKDQSPSSLLYTMATNHCFNLLKREKKKEVLVDQEFLESFPTQSQETERVQIQIMLEEIFKLEDEKTRSIAYYHYLEGYTLQETADLVGMSMSGIRKRLRNLQAQASVWKEEGHG